MSATTRVSPLTTPPHRRRTRGRAARQFPLLAIAVLAAAVAGCDATPLPYPPGLRADRLALAGPEHGALELTGSAGAVAAPGARLRARNASRPTAPVEARIAPDGSFSVRLGGFLADTVRLDLRVEADSYVLAHLASAGAPAVRRAAAPTDGDGDGFAAAADCRDDDPRVFPGAAELCDGIDNDCNGTADEGVACACTADADCDDGRFCNGPERCTTGSCVAGAPPVCLEACDPALNACVQVRPAVPICGNGLVESGEGCDDGNDVAGDGCEPNCTRTAP